MGLITFEGTTSHVAGVLLAFVWGDSVVNTMKDKYPSINPLLRALVFTVVTILCIIMVNYVYDKINGRKTKGKAIANDILDGVQAI
jgi:hypothetical protein